MIHRFFVAIAKNAPPGNGLRYNGKTLTYDAALKQVKGLAAGLKVQGIGPGDPVAVLLPNSPDLFVVVHALFAIGAIAMPLGTGAARAELERAIDKSGCVAVIASPELCSLAKELLPALSGKMSTRLFPAGGNSPHSIENLCATPPVPLPEISGEAPALYLLSSGTTGSPKIVVHTQAGLMADARRTSKAWNFTSEDVIFNMLPGNFALGLQLGILNALAAGAHVVYWHDTRPLVLARKTLLQTLEMEKVSVMGAVPAMYETLAAAQGAFDLSSIRLSFSGGAALSRETFETCRDRLGLTLRQAYGLTETLMVAHNDSSDVEGSWQSVGRPAGDAQAKIDFSEKGLAPGIGELLIKSSSLMSMYLNEDSETKACLSDGWLRTGDLARLDSEGNLYIVGRLKLLIEILGFKVDPIEVEQVLMEHEKIAEAVVSGVEGDARAGRRLKAFIVPKNGGITPEDLRRFLGKRLSTHKVPTLFEFRDELPKSSAGKVLRGQLAAGN